MEDIELVIKIPEGLKKDFESEQWTALSCMEMKDALEKATPLPKGHGAMIDISNIDVIELEDSMHYIRHEKGDEVDVYISAPTIIEADREVEE